MIQFNHKKNNQSYGTLNNSAERGRNEEIQIRQNDGDVAQYYTEMEGALPVRVKKQLKSQRPSAKQETFSPLQDFRKQPWFIILLKDIQKNEGYILNSMIEKENE